MLFVLTRPTIVALVQPLLAVLEAGLEYPAGATVLRHPRCQTLGGVWCLLYNYRLPKIQAPYQLCSDTP